MPATLVSAELGGAFAKNKGDIYDWVGTAFGSPWGFLAVWLHWIQNLTWFPVGLTFGAVALAFAIGRPDLADNGAFIGSFCIVVYWLATAVVLRGAAVFAKYANWTFIVGTLVLGLVLVGLLGYWLASGRPIGWQHLSDTALSEAGQPRWWPLIHDFGTVALFASIVLLFAGVEVQASCR